MPNIYIISAPSGAGKSSLIEDLTARDNTIKKSISVTTRKPRSSEVNGQHYVFTNEADFEARLKNGEFLEYALVHGNWYGTSKNLIEKELEKQNDLILEIDYQGARVVRNHYPSSISVFILPPNKNLLRSRLEKRNTDETATIEQRLKAAGNEISHISEYQYVIINRIFDSALLDLEAIIRSSRLAAYNRDKEEIINNFLKDE
ncbi:MAG: guanylate kinase [Burkholderiales bacterium]|nr:guanylate kinase [Burkholderiales bacterium]OUT77881.1 MAG: guanylate kinase [Betaproteobacteria bacterium TMED22]|tara:strand:+ start:35098 stop:35706 length:609 start_codon:yes stop_codon:yes gene_type:complete